MRGDKGGRERRHEPWPVLVVMQPKRKRRKKEKNSAQNENKNKREGKEEQLQQEEGMARVQWIWQSEAQKEKEQWGKAILLLRSNQGSRFGSPEEADTFVSRVSGSESRGFRVSFDPDFDRYTCSALEKARQTWENVDEAWLNWDHIRNVVLPFIIVSCVEAFDYFSSSPAPLLLCQQKDSTEDLSANLSRKEVLFINALSFFGLLSEQVQPGSLRSRPFRRLRFSSILNEPPSLFCLLHYFAVHQQLVCTHSHHPLLCLHSP